MEYVNTLEKDEKARILDIRNEIRKHGLDAFEKLNIRQLRGRLYEIKIFSHRIMYVISDPELVLFLHICKKQKGKAEQFELKKALRRSKEAGIS